MYEGSWEPGHENAVEKEEQQLISRIKSKIKDLMGMMHIFTCIYYTSRLFTCTIINVLYVYIYAAKFIDDNIIV